MYCTCRSRLYDYLTDGLSFPYNSECTHPEPPVYVFQFLKNVYVPIWNCAFFEELFCFDDPSDPLKTIEAITWLREYLAKDPEHGLFLLDNEWYTPKFGRYTLEMIWNDLLKRSESSENNLYVKKQIS